MRHMLGYLQLEGPYGQCVELVNGARTLALMSEPDVCRAHPSWRMRHVGRLWDGNECWAFDSGQYGAVAASWDDPLGEQDLNPWEDSDNPATFETAGFLPDPPGPGLGIQLESPLESRVIGSNRAEPLELIITGTVVAGSSRGEHAFLRWLTSTLTEPEAYRLGWKSATVFTHCPDEDDWAGVADPFDLPPDPTGEPAYTTWDDGAPNELQAWTDPTPWPLDSGLRELFDVRFVSIDPLNDGPLFPHCVGRRYALRFTVGNHRMFDRPRTLATLGGSGSWNTSETYSNPLSVSDGVAPVDPFETGPPGLVVPPQSSTWTGLKSRSGRWALPDNVMRLAALTPPRPATLEDRIVLTVTNPSTTKSVYNARIRFWEALVNYPHPNTQVGDAFYRDRRPAQEIRLTELGPTETIVFDGRTGRTTLSRPGFTINNVPGRIEGLDGVRVAAPVLRCDERYWVAAELSDNARSYGDLDLEVTVQAAQQDFPT